MRFDVTKEELETIWKNVPNGSYWNTPSTIEIATDGESYFSFKVQTMYEAPTLNLEILRRLANLFQSENINDDDRFGYGGCETCDWGSSYGYTLTVRP